MNTDLHFSSKTDLWYTPQDTFDALNKEFSFTLDPCCTHENAKCYKHYTKEDDGLSKSWDGEIVFMNPPYGREISMWVEKAVSSDATVVMLLPSRTDTRWFHNYLYWSCELRFIKGRLKFGGAKNSAPFPSMIAIHRKLERDLKD